MDGNIQEKMTLDFIRNAESYWLDIKGGNSKAANKKIKENEKIVQRLVECDEVVGCLARLLEHESDYVRFSAAAHLVKWGLREQSIAVLRELAANPKGLVAPTAKIVLEFHGIEQ
ncbi:MAG: hypothetical protein HPY82_02980 [Gammaproteobacteria bacterium]|nr:hypothetical protein [Gammaproteobacteria bacterium]